MKNLKRGFKIYGAELAKQSLSKHATPWVNLGEQLTVPLFKCPDVAQTTEQKRIYNWACSPLLRFLIGIHTDVKREFVADQVVLFPFLLSGLH